MSTHARLLNPTIEDLKIRVPKPRALFPRYLYTRGIDHDITLTSRRLISRGLDLIATKLPFAGLM